MTTRISMRTEDAPVDPRYGRTRDTVLGPKGPLITGAMRIGPEKAPPAGDLGVRYTGNESPDEPVDVDELATRITKGFDDLLTPEQLAKLKKILARYAGSPDNTSRVGITSNDSTDAVDEARAAVAYIRGNCDRLASINDRNRSFWDKKIEADEARLYR